MAGSRRRESIAPHMHTGLGPDRAGKGVAARQRMTIGQNGRWIAVVGSRPEGRDGVLDALIAALGSAGTRVGGLIQRTRWTGGVIAGYDLCHPTRGETHALAREDTIAPELCRWRFVPEAFAQARRWTLEEPCDAVLLEAGRLEAAERGHWRTILDALATERLVVLSVRRGVLAHVALALPDPLDAIELPAAPPEVAAFVARTRVHARAPDAS